MGVLTEELLASREGAAIDFKQDGSSPKGIVKDFVAFSNTSGGFILIGVADDKTVLGLDDPQRVEEAITNSIYSSIEPAFSPQVFITTHDDKELVVVEAPYYQGPEPLALKKDGETLVYERVGSSSMLVEEEARLEQMRRERQGQAGYDQLPMPAAQMNDLNVAQIMEEFEAAGAPLEDDSKLESFDLVAKINQQAVPTRAGLLLFGQEDFREHVPDDFFRAIRYPGTDKAGDAVDTAEWSDVPLLEAVDGVLDFIARNTGTAEVREGRRRRDVPHYSELVLRELLHNAVAHADYSETGMHLNVSIYNDRLEIDSPGQWMAGMSEEQLRSGVSKARNRAITNTMHDLKYIERRGSAWSKALQEQERGYPLPEWTVPGPLVRAIVRQHPAAASASEGAGEKPARTRRDRTEEVFQIIEREGEAGAKFIAEELKISGRQVRTYLDRLEEAGRIEPTTESKRDPTRAFRVRK